MRALILAAALAACSQQTSAPEPATDAHAKQQSTEANLARMPAWNGARAAGVDFRGVGQEPRAG